MLRISIVSLNQTIKFHSIRFKGLSNEIPFKNDRNFLNRISNLTLVQKYGFFRNEKTIDYKKNYYEILQVNETATLVQIKKSFYKLAKQSHPDTSKGNEDLFKSINEAYNVLSHQDRRKIYDANRVRKETENPNDAKAQAQRNTAQAHGNQSSTFEQEQSNREEEYKNSEQYAQQTAEAYYHYNQGQWQQFRSGYKYHVSPEYEYYMNLTNNVSDQKVFQNLKRRKQKKAEKDQLFLNQMEQYFAYLEKVKQKKQKNMEEYHAKLEEMKKQLKEERRELFRKSLIGRGYYGVKNIFVKMGQLFSKQSKQSK